MESAAKIRRLVLRDGRSIRSVSRSTGLSRNTIKKYLQDASPPRYHRSGPPVRHKLQGFEDRLRSLFEQDQKRARRERRTSVKLYEQLVEEGYTGSYSPVCRFVKALKADGSELLHAYIPLHFKAGDALQFDWSEEHVVLGGVEQKIKVAHFRLCHSRKSFVVAYPGESQEMVLDAFVRALAFYGGVPRRVIIDNPKTMVTYVSRSKDRVYHPRFLALMNHYVMEPSSIGLEPMAPFWTTLHARIGLGERADREPGSIEYQMRDARFPHHKDFATLDYCLSAVKKPEVEQP